MLNKSALYLTNTISNQRHRPGQKRGLCAPRSPRPHHLPCNDISCHFCCKSLDISFRIPLLCQDSVTGRHQEGRTRVCIQPFLFYLSAKKGIAGGSRKHLWRFLKHQISFFSPLKSEFSVHLLAHGLLERTKYSLSSETWFITFTTRVCKRSVGPTP